MNTETSTATQVSLSSDEIRQSQNTRNITTESVDEDHD